MRCRSVQRSSDRSARHGTRHHGHPIGGVMKTKAHFQRYWRVVASTTPRLLLLITTFLLLFLIGKRVANRTTLAGNTVGSFEIDGNLAVDHLVRSEERRVGKECRSR